MSVSTEVTFPQQRNVAIVCPKAKRKGELCLNPICSASSHFHIRRGLKDRWSQYRFPHSIFPQTLSASSLSAAVLSFFFTIFLFSSLVLHLHSTRLVFLVPHFISLSLTVSIFQSRHVRLLSVRLPISIGGRGRRHFQILSASISQNSWGGLIQSVPAGEVDSDI